MTLEQLKKRRDDILKRCEHWKTCNDGSYEMALHNSGYLVVLELISKLEENNGKNETTVGGDQLQDSKR